MDVMIVMLGVTGNSLVLIGSIRYGAIDLDQFSVLLLENIAVAGSYKFNFLLQVNFVHYEFGNY